MNQLKGVCDTESAVVSLWKGCGLKWEELGVKGEDLEQLIAREVILLTSTKMYLYSTFVFHYTCIIIYIYTHTVYCCN